MVFAELYRACDCGSRSLINGGEGEGGGKLIRSDVRNFLDSEL